MRMTRTWWPGVLLACPAMAQPWFAGVERLPGDTEITVRGLSADGRFAVGSSSNNTRREAFRWTRAGGTQGLGDFAGGDFQSSAAGVSAHGYHVVGSGVSGVAYDGFRWQGGVMTGIGDLPGGSTESFALDVSADGRVVVGYSFTDVLAPNHRQAFYAVAGGPLISIGDLPGGSFENYGFDVSDDGAVITGIGGSALGEEAFRWTLGSGLVGLGDLPGGVFGSRALGMSCDGSVVVGASETAAGTEAFRWTQAGGMISLGDLPGGIVYGTAEDVSGDGSVVVGFGAVAGGTNDAFIWDAQHGMRNLRDVFVAMGMQGLQGWHLISAYAITADGLTIAGDGTNPEGGEEGWVAYIGQPLQQSTERSSISYAEQQGNGGSTGGSVSNDGQVVAFWSNAANLVGGDTNGKADVFVRNRAAAWTTRVSVSTAGVQANGDSSSAQISGNGRFVVFASTASNLVGNDTNATRDIFLRDRIAETTTRLSTSTVGAQANGPSDLPRMSADGRFVVFQSDATNLVEGDTNGKTDIFLRDRQSGTTTRISIRSDNLQANGDSYEASVSDNGLSVVYSTKASNLVTGDTNNVPDVMLRNRQANQTVRVNVSTAGTQANAASAGARVSGNGRYIAFTSSASNLSPGDSNGADDAFIRDRFNATTTRISLYPAQGNADSAVAAISANGRFVLFSSFASNLVAGDSNAARDAFIYDNWSFSTQRISVGDAGQQAAAACAGTALSADGRFAVFNSLAGNLVPGDSGFSDVFLRDLRKPQ